MTRHQLREQTFRMLFGAGFHESEDKEQSLRNYLSATLEEELGEEETAELIRRVLAVDERSAELDSAIDSVSKTWKTARMGRTELCILRLALYEMLYDDAVPDKVAINEAVELSKEYCSDEAPSFINGVLAKLMLKKEAGEAPET